MSAKIKFALSKTGNKILTALEGKQLYLSKKLDESGNLIVKDEHSFICGADNKSGHGVCQAPITGCAFAKNAKKSPYFIDSCKNKNLHTCGIKKQYISYFRKDLIKFNRSSSYEKGKTIVIDELHDETLKNPTQEKKKSGVKSNKLSSISVYKQNSLYHSKSIARNQHISKLKDLVDLFHQDKNKIVMYRKKRIKISSMFVDYSQSQESQNKNKIYVSTSTKIFPNRTNSEMVGLYLGRKYEGIWIDLGITKKQLSQVLPNYQEYISSKDKMINLNVYSTCKAGTVTPERQYYIDLTHIDDIRNYLVIEPQG